MSTVYRNLFAMGTRFDMVLPGIDEETGDFVFSLIRKEIQRLEEMLSNYIEFSTLSKLNKTAPKSPFVADNELFELICDLKRMYSASLGYFDISIGNYTGSGSAKAAEGLRPKPFSGSLDEIVTNDVEKSIWFATPRLTIDSGGFGKGFTLENVKKVLSDHNINQGFISFGESSVLVLGNHPFGEGWKVSIPDIYSSESVCVFHLKNNALSVSGNTPANLIKYPQGHIINLVAGARVSKSGLVCVSGPSAFYAEILSTALFIAGEKEQKQILNNFPGYKAVRVSYEPDSKTPDIKEIEFNIS